MVCLLTSKDDSGRIRAVIEPMPMEERSREEQGANLLPAHGRLNSQSSIPTLLPPVFPISLAAC